MKSRISNRSISRRISALAFASLIGTCAIGGSAFAQATPAAPPATAPAPTPAAAPAAPGPVVGNVDAARNKVSMCIGCHGLPGYRSSFPEVYSVPMIAGQNAKYLEMALSEYKSGARSHLTMVGIAKSLSEQDIADVAAYYSNLK
ncbi:cytochrome c [Pigmentiphaga aceris]|uniref:Cytochrome c n=1 Tax=Pigmentiphaga aceris TaxID=1940612 RepID=A0A5C0B0C9_9BURK|nr:cytochrome c [Pigmentiphaga aceris]QEI07153.1 cytochrome c [Pigmentiphaga aceris]